MHWLGGVIGDTENSNVAEFKVESFIAQIKRIKSNGVKIIWTVHNILPHDSKLKETQVKLRVELTKNRRYYTYHEYRYYSLS